MIAGPRQDARPGSDRERWTRAARRRGVRFEANQQPIAVLRDGVRCRRRDVQRQTGQGRLAARFCRRFEAPASRRAESVGTVCGARADPSAGASARDTKSTGRNHVRPSRTGEAGSETSRPPTDASGWPGVNAIVCARVETVSPPASGSSRTVSSNSRARSSSENISCPANTRAARDCRPSFERTVYGAGVTAVWACATAATHASVTAADRRSAAAKRRGVKAFSMITLGDRGGGSRVARGSERVRVPLREATARPTNPSCCDQAERRLSMNQHRSPAFAAAPLRRAGCSEDRQRIR